MENFGLLAAEICWWVWGTRANFNAFRVSAALLHGSLVVGISQICGVEHRPPPIFGRAAITLGICPHSSYLDIEHCQPCAVSCRYSCRPNDNELTCTLYIQDGIAGPWRHQTLNQRVERWSVRSVVRCSNRLMLKLTSFLSSHNSNNSSTRTY